MAENLKELFSYRLNLLANLSTRIAVMRNEREHGLSMRDWRIVALLGAFAPMSLNHLAREANLDKSQASRGVAELIERRLISRATDETDGRGVKLSLTAAGRGVYRRVFPKAVARNERLLSALTLTERRALQPILEKLTERALTLLADERSGRPQGNRRARRNPGGGRGNGVAQHVRAA